MYLANIQSWDSAKRFRTFAGWAFFGLVVAAYFHALSFGLAKTIGVSCLAWYYFRYGREDQQRSEQAIFVLGALVAIFAWGQFYHGLGDVSFEKQVDKICNSRQVNSQNIDQNSACEQIQIMINERHEAVYDDNRGD